MFARFVVYLLQHCSPASREILFATIVEECKKKNLSNEERQLLTAMLLDKLGALPLHARITLDNTGAVIVNGRRMDSELAAQLKRNAATMQLNAARKLVREAVTFMAIVDGVHKNINPEMGLFAKAALWFMQEEDALYKKLAEHEEDFDE